RTTFALEFAVNRVPLQELWPLALAFAPRGFDRWSGLDPGGELRSVGAQVVRERAGALPRFAVAAELDSVSVRPVGRWPGFSGLTASLSGTDEVGSIVLRAQQPSFSMPRYFRNPLDAEKLAADGGWSREGRTWALHANHFEVEHASGSARGSLEFRFQSRRVSPELTLQARVERADLSAVAGFIPIGRLRPNTVAWLERAFVAGEVTGGELSYRGPVRRFPFPKGEGEFRATADVTGATIDYYDGFRPLSAATGQVEFRDASISARIEKGRIGELVVARGEFSMPDYRSPVIEVDAAGSGDVGEALEILRSSPLGPRLGEQFMALRGSGPADYELALHMATQDPDDRRFLVRTTLRSATVSTPMLRAPAREVVGELELQQDLVRSESLRGRFLGGPFELAIRPGARTGNVTLAIDFEGRGRVAGAELPAFIGLPAQISMSGSTDWRLQGRLEREGLGGSWPARFDVRSDLQGLEISAPRPFAKPAGQARPTLVRAAVPRAGAMNLRIQSGSADARLEFLRSAEGLWNLRAGIARFDGQPLGSTVRPGLQLLGDWPDFDLAEWLALSPGVPSDRRLQDWLGPAEVHLDEARVLGFEFRDVTARLTPLESAWSVSVSGPMAVGTVTIPFDLNAAAPMVLQMQRLELESPEPETQRSDPSAGETDPRTLPGLEVEVGEFIWQARRFGKLSADIRRSPQGLRMDRLQTRSAEFSLDGTGSWLAEGEGSRTSLELSFQSQDLAAAARALRYSDAVEAERAGAEARLEWEGGPSEQALGRMNGSLSLELERGQLRTVKPGAGRMLGLLSVTELPRRLALDFRDVTDEGLAFDSVRGDFQIRDGNAYTENLLLKGAVLDIGVAGRTGLATQDYDQTIVVSGNPSGALTVAGALAAGPIGAASALLISQLFKGQLQGLTRVYYRVTGPWASPKVEQISAVNQSSAAGEPGAEPKP
ncbi:MAG TPA: YhdP family protein, partial [Steroidobacteraceae bacterium]|nr:YhdP family protein [Steroidobacteraceae bacterium]